MIIGTDKIAHLAVSYMLTDILIEMGLDWQGGLAVFLIGVGYEGYQKITDKGNLELMDIAANTIGIITCFAINSFERWII